MDFKIAIISLKDSPRRNQITITPDYLIDAVNGLDYTVDELQKRLISITGKKFITCRSVPFTNKWKIRIAIFISHLLALQCPPAHSLTPLLILEDDFKSNYPTPRDIQLISPPLDWDILFLGGFWTNKRGHTEKPIDGWNYIDHTKIKFWCCVGYIVKEPTKLIEYIKQFGALTTLDSYYNRWIFKKMRCYYLYPAVIQQNLLLESSIKCKKYRTLHKKQLQI